MNIQFFFRALIQNLKKSPVRSGLIFFSTTIGVAMCLSIASINEAILQSFQNDIESISGKAELTLLGDEAGIPESLTETAAKVPGVASAIPIIETRAYPRIKGASTLTILGVDLLKEDAVRSYEVKNENSNDSQTSQTIDDPLVFLNQPDSIILTREFALRHHLKLDDRIEMDTINGVKKLVVRGLLSPTGPARAFGGNIAIMDIDGARVIFGKENKVDRIEIVLKPGFSSETVEKLLHERFGDRVRIEPPQTRSQDLDQMTAGFRAMINFFGSLALLVSLFIIANTMKVSLVERLREIALFRLLGLTSRAALIWVLFENVLLGIFAGILGTLFSPWIAEQAVKGVVDSMMNQFSVVFYPQLHAFDVLDLFKGIALGVIASLVGTFLPALRSYRIQPIEAFRGGRDLEHETGKSRKPWGLMGAALVLGLTIYPGLGPLNPLFMIFSISWISPWIFRKILKLIIKIEALPTLFLLSVQNLYRSGSKTSAYISTLNLSLILVLLIECLSFSLKDTILTWFDIQLQDHVYVSMPGNIQRFLSQPMNESLTSKIAAVPGVSYAMGMRVTHIKYQNQMLAIKAFDKPEPTLKYHVFDLHDGDVEKVAPLLFRPLSSREETNVFVSSSFVKNFHLKTGDSVILQTPTEGNKSFKIVGVVTDFASPIGTIYLSRSTYKELWKDSLISIFSIRSQDTTPEGIIKTRSQIDETLARSTGIVTYLNADIRNNLTLNIDKSFGFTKAISGTALLLAFLSLFSAFSVSLLLKVRELLLLRSIGMSRWQLLKVHLGEAITQGFLGGSVTLILGGIGISILIRGSLAALLGWPLQPSATPMIYAQTLAISTLICIAAILVPSIKLIRLKLSSSSIGE